ncbi:MAG: hypothetical protein Q4C48_05410 [Lachnospiraceae bacterium]|nr:hypothetical protein [Lachnospiraceae bacterium]
MKKIVGIMGCVCLLAGILALSLSLYKNREKEEKPPTSKYRDEGWFPGEYAAYAVREKYPTDILWIGPWEEYEWELPVRFAETVDRETLTMRDGFQYMYIVVNDLEGSVTLTEEEYRLINAYVKSDSRYHFVYLGKEKLAEICEYGFGDKEQVTPADYSVGMYHYGERLVSSWGIYSQNDIDNELGFCECVIGGLESHFPQE